MAGKSAAKKFLLGLCVFFVALAALGAWVGLSIERKQAGDLRSSVFDGVGPSWLRGHTFGNPEVSMSDLTDIDFEKFNTDTLKGKGFAYDEKTKLLTAKESQFKVQLKEGDLLKFFLHGDGETTEARVVKINSSIEVELNGAHHLHLHGDVTVRLCRPFTGTEYRFYGEPGKAGVDTHYDTLKAPRDHFFTKEGVLLEGSPPVHDDHGGHGGGHGESYHYVPNIRPGQFKDFYKNWPLGKYYRHVKYECQYKEGTKHGNEQYWQNNGHSNWKKTWKEGNLDGSFEEWYSSGEKKLSAKYLDGKLHDVYITFHPNGEKSLKTHFKEGKLHGRYETWNAFKNRLYNLNYEYGSLKPKSTGGGSGH